MKKDQKNVRPKSVAKGVTMAAMVAALGISLGTEVKCVYAQGNELAGGSKINLEGALAFKVETEGAREIKNTSVLNQSISGTVTKINGNLVTIKDKNNKLWTLPVSSSNGTDAVDMFRVGDVISGKIVNGQVVASPPSR
ncbi:MAG: hypothetical protein FP816_15210 [Desulfobacteraceae bacterium]|nr:hypothetical protein [Desulfobacteraceae bacterium]MBU4037383.1 hypothetical protein [Pseudomonadota bacterium]